MLNSRFLDYTHLHLNSNIEIHKFRFFYWKAGCDLDLNSNIEIHKFL